MMRRIGRVAYYVIYPFQGVLKLMMSKKRVRVAVYSPAGRILLVKTWFGAQRWSLPGGGIKRRESALAAALRELDEETSIHASASELTEIGELLATDDLAFDLKVFQLQVSDETLDPLQRGRSLEIIGRKWFDVDALPDDVSQTVVWALEHDIHRTKFDIKRRL